MKDEIKEILNEIKILNGNVELGYEKSQILLDYITNLQEKLNEVKEIVCYMSTDTYTDDYDIKQEYWEKLDKIVGE